MPCEHSDLAGGAGDDQHVRVALEDRPVGRDELDVECRMVCDVGHGLEARCYAAAVSSELAFSTTSSIGPTM